jgi:hypothetical protein
MSTTVGFEATVSSAWLSGKRNPELSLVKKVVPSFVLGEKSVPVMMVFWGPEF